MRLHTVGLAVLLAGALLAVARMAAPQPRDPLPMIGILSLLSPPTSLPFPPCDVLFRQSLHDLGYVEGHTIRFAYRYAESQTERLPALATELVQLAPNVLFTWGSWGVLAAQQATATIPILAGSADLISSGIITKLAQPDGNITGLTWYGPELTEKRLEVLKDAVPQSTRMGLLVQGALGRLVRTSLHSIFETGLVC